MKLKEKIKLDIQANKDNGKGKAVAVSYRIANHIFYSRNIFIRIIGKPFVKLYHWIFIWVMGIEIPEETKIGTGLQVWHGVALVINPKVVIGNNVLLRHCTTIGNKFLGSDVPIIGNNVEIGAHSVLIGNITIGDNVTIGAGTIVTKSVPPDSIAFGNPMKIISKTKS